MQVKWGQLNAIALKLPQKFEHTHIEIDYIILVLWIANSSFIANWLIDLNFLPVEVTCHKLTFCCTYMHTYSISLFVLLQLLLTSQSVGVAFHFRRAEQITIKAANYRWSH